MRPRASRSSRRSVTCAIVPGRRAQVQPDGADDSDRRPPRERMDRTMGPHPRRRSRPHRRRLAMAGLAVASLAPACSYEPRAVTPLVPISAVESSDLFAADGTKIYTFPAEDNRDLVALETLPLPVRNAVLANQDARYEHHPALDPPATP